MIKTALAQISCFAGDIKANCAKISDYARRAADKGCGAVVFPEMTDTGYDISIIKETASPWPGLPYDTCRESALNNKIHIICGLSERESGSVYNSVAVFTTEGILEAKYRKMHLFPADPINEKENFVQGNSLVTAEIGGLTWGFTICYDLRFPEIYRGLALAGAKVLVNCSAWPETRSSHWEILGRARAVENQAYFLGANRTGRDTLAPFCGKSCIIKPWGDYAGLGSSDTEELIIADIDPDNIESFRKKVPVFASRRDDIY